MNRHQLGYWLSDKIPSHILANSVLDIFDSKSINTKHQTKRCRPTIASRPWGYELSRLSILSEAHLQLED